MLRKFVLLIILFSFILCFFNCINNKDTNNSDGDSNEVSETTAILNDATVKFYEFQDNENYDDAILSITIWLNNHEKIESAILSPDGYTVIVNFKSGESIFYITKYNGEEFDEDWGTGKDSYKSKNNSRDINKNILTLTNPPTVMYPIIFTPFQFQDKTTDYIEEFEDVEIANYYKDPFTGHSQAIIYRNEEADIAAFASAFLYMPGASIIHIRTHGGLGKDKNNNEMAYFSTGEPVTNENNEIYKPLLDEGLLMRGYFSSEDTAEYYLLTPDFIKTYSSKPAEEHKKWMSRYIHLFACCTYHSSLVDAFSSTGTVCFSSYDDITSALYGTATTKELFKNLYFLDSFQEAYNKINIKVDPDNPACDFKIAGNLSQYFFYKSTFSFDIAGMHTLSCQWLSVDDKGDGSVWFSSTTVDNTTDQLSGNLAVSFKIPSAGSYNVNEVPNEIVFNDASDNSTWVASKSEQDLGKPCDGIITVSSFDNTHGGIVKGSFIGNLTNLHQTSEPYDIKIINGNFILIRNKN